MRDFIGVILLHAQTIGRSYLVSGCSAGDAKDSVIVRAPRRRLRRQRRFSTARFVPSLSLPAGDKFQYFLQGYPPIADTLARSPVRQFKSFIGKLLPNFLLRQIILHAVLPNQDLHNVWRILLKTLPPVNRN